MEETAADKAVRSFLATGLVRGIDEAELASACARFIVGVSRQSLKKALVLAKRFEGRAEDLRGPLRFMSLRVLAQISHLSGAHREALTAYQKALPMARAEPLIRARIDRTLIDIYMYLGDAAASKRSARRAMRAFRALKAEPDLAQTKVNYANLLHRQDRHREARALYREAADFFEGSDNHVATARCYYNLANTLVQLFEVDQAERLYQEALRIYTDAGYELDACDTRYGLAWLWMLSGRFHSALLELAACEKVYRESGDPRGAALCSLDRAEVYLGLGLYHDALQAARLSERAFLRLGLRYESAKSSLFRGQAATAVGRRKEAREAVARARTGFEFEHNSGFLGVVHLLEAELSDSDQRRRGAIKAARSCFTRSQLPLWEGICDAREVFDPLRAQSALRRLSRNRAAQVVPHLYALWQTAFGDLEYRRGDDSVARQSWRRAADRLDAVRAQLPPVELRSSYGQQGFSPHARLVSSELERDVMAAAVWSERKKTAGVWAPIAAGVSSDPVRQRVGQSLATLAQQYAGLARQISSTKGGERGLSAISATRSVSRLQQRIRHELLALEVGGSGALESVEELAETFRTVSEQVPIVQFHQMDDTIVAFVHQRGKVAVQQYPGGGRRLREGLERWRFLMEAEVFPDYPGRTERIAAERALWRDFGSWLWMPLGLLDDCSEVLILPEGELANLPWSALAVGDAPLAERHRFITAPSLRHYVAACASRADSREVAVFRGKADDLPMVDHELNALVERAGRQARLHKPGRRDSWPDEGEAHVWHFSGHAELCEDNPFYSYLVLEDGPLFATDFRLKRCRVNLVTLAACRSGEQVALPGEEVTGLVRSLLEMGARNVIAGRWPVSDATTALWMREFYDRYFGGSSILDSARLAALTLREQFPSAFHWAAFSVAGAGN